MNMMRETTTTSVTTSADHERNLDALLEDLQTTVSRSNSSLNLNGNVTGYRELRRTYTDGTPEGTMTEYQIEYLNPANSTHHMIESSGDGMHNSSAPRSKSVTTYKYNTVETKSGSGGASDMKMKQNISELDSLLDDLNTAQKKNFSESTTISNRNLSGTDPTLLDSSSHNLIRSEQKSYSDDKGFRGGRGSARRELVFTGGQRSQDPSPIREQMYYEQHEQSPKMQQYYRYEKTTSTRTTGPSFTDTPPAVEPGHLPSNTIRNYTYTDESPLPIRHRSPSPGGTVNSYHYSSSSTSRDVPPPQSPPLDKYRGHPDDYLLRQGGSYTYSNTTRESRSDNRGRTPPPPHRSPSPVSFAQPPPPTRTTTVKTHSYDQHVSGGGPPHRPPSPGQKFSPSDPSHNRLTYNIPPAPSQPHHSNTVTNYKYSSTTHHHHHPQSPEDTVPLMPRPFPTPQPSTISSSPPPPHSDQQPPKKLDELMASFSDADQRHNRFTETTVHHYTSTNSTPHPPPQPIILHPSNENEKFIEKEKEKDFQREKEREKEKLITREDSRNVSGPPVYYPPGVELFAKKEESMMQQQSGGGRYRAKAKYEYEAKSKSKMKESSGKAVVPVCLPLCCAMPCVIM